MRRQFRNSILFSQAHHPLSHPPNTSPPPHPPTRSLCPPTPPPPTSPLSLPHTSVRLGTLVSPWVNQLAHKQLFDQRQPRVFGVAAVGGQAVRLDQGAKLQRVRLNQVTGSKETQNGIVIPTGNVHTVTSNQKDVPDKRNQSRGASPPSSDGAPSPALHTAPGTLRPL